MSQMNVEQARSQYETAAATIPQIESQIAQTENALSILLGRNPGPIKRGKTIYELQLPLVPSGLPSGNSGQPAGYPRGGTKPDFRQRSDRRGPGASTSRRSP
ncbi:MAG: hypothetical protein MZU95_12060 [Desulfomicrobium escambiense]|nr:hypothetical protein [Desulfomicrobium escambiense]